ncbi:hypothetical protein GYH30_057138 [Glycine max]|nr:hypothetical protein GYH30_057138 [Glycine max]
MTETKAAEDAKEMVLLEEEKCAKKMVCMWGYLPRASLKKSPILSLVPVNLSDPSLVGDSWKDVCGGGCEFTIATILRAKLLDIGEAWGNAVSVLMQGLVLV